MTIPIVRLDAVDSTNDEAKRRLASGAAPERFAITAREQTAGRGTRGRAWSSPRDAGLYLTYVDARRRDEPWAATPIVTLAAGVACAEALDAFGVPVRLKPVNDLLVDGCKLGGILTESIVRDGAFAALLVGVGINLRSVPLALDRPVAPTSLETILPPPVFAALDRGALVEALLDRLAHHLARLESGAAETVVAEWEARADRAS